MSEPPDDGWQEVEISPGRLDNCSRAFLLLTTGVLFQIVGTFVVARIYASGPEQNRTPPLESYAVALGTLAVAMIPAAVLLWRNAETERWKRAAFMLAAAAAVDLVVILTLCVLREPNVVLTDPEPLVVRTLAMASELMTWMEYWCIAVVIADFALACRLQMIVDNTEILGYMILTGFGVNLVYAGWSLPSPLPPGSPADTMTLVLQGLFMFITFITTFGSLYMLYIVFSLAHMLSMRVR